MNAVLAVSTARSQLAKEYEAKMLAMDREHQRRLREEVRPLFSSSRSAVCLTSVVLIAGDYRAQAVEADTKFNAKLDILTRLQAARTPARGAATRRDASTTPSTAYDDSDDEEDEDELEEEEGRDEEEDDEEEEDGELRDDSEEVRDMLLPGAAADASLAESTVRPDLFFLTLARR